MSKKISIILALIIIVTVGGFIYWNNNQDSGLVGPGPCGPGGENCDENGQLINNRIDDEENEKDDVPKFEDGTIPDTNTSGNDASYVYYTMAEVSTHNSTSSCWAAINGGVYDLTSWIGKHPGGPEAIKSICGKDGSAAFNNQHNGQENPAAALASFRIGVLR